MVGCVIARADGTQIAEGFHRRCGQAHAEVDALRAAGAAARGATAIVTLEPCNHRGRTGPCSEALLEAGVAEVVYAVADPNPLAVGGAARLAQAGVRVRHVPHAPSTELALPFLRRVTSGLPWICAKWAQSIDGAIALANGDSRWISCARSRAMVHRERGRVDAILTGLGTVLADDPRLTARGVRVQRRARRVVFDPEARLPLECALADGSCPTTVLVRAGLDAQGERRLQALADRGVDALRLGATATTDESLGEPLRALAQSGVATVLVESGGGLVGRLLREDLLDEAFVFVAPLVVADAIAPRGARGLAPEVLAEVRRARTMSVRRRGDDALLHYRWRTAETPA